MWFLLSAMQSQHRKLKVWTKSGLRPEQRSCETPLAALQTPAQVPATTRASGHETTFAVLHMFRRRLHEHSKADEDFRPRAAPAPSPSPGLNLPAAL